MATLGKQIHDARVQLGISRGHRVSQSDLAKMIGASRSAVNAWENDRTIPDDYDRAALEKVLGVPLIVSYPPAAERVRQLLASLPQEQRERLIAEWTGQSPPPPPQRERPGEDAGRHRRTRAG